jgi:hypothetical protein
MKENTMVNKNRKVILSVRYAKEDANCYTPKDGRCLDFASFADIRMFINITDKKPKSICYKSTDKLFVVYITYTHCTSREYHNNENDYARLLIKEMWECEKETTVKERKELGYVHTYNNPLPLIDLWGKLPKQIILDNLEYLASGTAFGYFGAYERMIKHDEWIAELYENTDFVSKARISQFLNHSKARHFMDNVYPETTKEEFLDRMTNYMEGL